MQDLEGSIGRRLVYNVCFFHYLRMSLINLQREQVLFIGHVAPP